MSVVKRAWRRPAALTVGAILASFFAGIWLIVLSGYALDAPSATVTLNDEVVPRAEFFARGGGWIVALVVAWTVIAFGLWRHRRWVRPLMVASWLLLGRVITVDAETRTDALVALGTCGLVAVLAGWYLYGSESVRRYYASIAAQQASAAPDRDLT